MSGKLYTYPDNFRADKIRAVANISGYKLDVASEYTHGVTNKTPEFQAKFFGKVIFFINFSEFILGWSIEVRLLHNGHTDQLSNWTLICFWPNEINQFQVPAFESGDVALCDDTAIAHFVGNAQTRGGERSADVLCWAGFAENTLLPSVAQWVWPALSIVQPNKAHMNDAKANLKAAFGFINDVLSKQTFLVGERITYADISCCLTLKSAFENVLTAEFRSGFPHVTRWFNTVMNQPGVKSVVGDVTMCEKEAQFDAKKYNEMAGKPQKEKAKKEPKKQEPKKEKKAEPKPAAEPEKPKEKPSDPWADCDKFTMDMDAWKRFYSNNDEDKSVEHFWTLVSRFSIWKYSVDLLLIFRLPQKSRPTTPCGRVPTNTLTNLPCLSWLPILSEVSF